MIKNRETAFAAGFVVGLVVVFVLVLKTFVAAFSGDSQLERRQNLARIARIANPGYSSCGRCGMPWAVVEGHSTLYSERWGMFPLCVECWTELGTPDARLPFYRALYESHKQDGEMDDDTYHNWSLIEAAVMSGK